MCSDLYSELIFEEFLLCCGHLFFHSPAMAVAIREQPAGGCLAMLLDEFLTDDFLPRYRLEGTFSGAATAAAVLAKMPRERIAASSASAASASASAKISHERRNRGDPTQAALHSYAKSRDAAAGAWVLIVLRTKPLSAVTVACCLRRFDSRYPRRPSQCTTAPQLACPLRARGCRARRRE